MYCKVSLPNIIQAIDDGLVLIMATLFRKNCYEYHLKLVDTITKCQKVKDVMNDDSFSSGIQ